MFLLATYYTHTYKSWRHDKLHVRLGRVTKSVVFCTELPRTGQQIKCPLGLLVDSGLLHPCTYYSKQSVGTWI